MIIDYKSFFPPEAGRWPTAMELYCSDCAQVPEERGVYFICIPPEKEVAFQPFFWRPARNPNQSTPYPVETLEKKYMCQGCPCLLYIGKADGQKGLRQRLRQYIRHGWGESGNHLGGRAVWQVSGCQELLVLWAVCQDPAQEERALLEAFQSCKNDYPLANWRS